MVLNLFGLNAPLQNVGDLSGTQFQKRSREARQLEWGPGQVGITLILSFSTYLPTPHLFLHTSWHPSKDLVAPLIENHLFKD